MNKGGVDNSSAFTKLVEPGPGASCSTVASRGLPLNVGRSRGLPGTLLLKWRLKASRETWTRGCQGGGSARAWDPHLLNVGRSRGLPGTLLLKWGLKTSKETWTRISRTVKAIISSIFQEGTRVG